MSRNIHSCLFCVYNEPSADSCLHENLHSANVHHRAARRDDTLKRRRQYNYIMDYANAHNVRIVKVFHRDVVAQNGVDRHYNQLVDFVRQGKADGVIVAAMMCISKDIPDAFRKIGQMKVAGGVVVSVDDGNNLDMDIKEVGVYGRS